jgi:hypothetical protein
MPSGVCPKLIVARETCEKSANLTRKSGQKVQRCLLSGSFLNGPFLSGSFFGRLILLKLFFLKWLFHGQIRIHAAHAGLPIVGDNVYGRSA